MKQKAAAENRMQAFDDMPDHVREVMRAGQTVHNTQILLSAGVRTFEQGELAIAGVWDGR